MAKYYPNKLTGSIATATDYWGVNKKELEEQGYIVDFFRENQYDGQNYYILRKQKKNGEFEFEKVTHAGIKFKLPLLLTQGWEIVKKPSV